MLNATFTGPDVGFFNTAFYDFTNFPFFAATVTSISTTKFVMQQDASGAITTFTGSGFTVNASDQITGGTISSIEYSQGGMVQANYAGMSWDAVTFYNGVAQFGGVGNHKFYFELLDQQDVYLDGRGAVVESEPGDFGKNYSHKIKLDGSRFDDGFKAGAGRDVLKGFKGDDDFSGRGGNDRIFGGLGKDDLSGGNGKDKISGGKGADMLAGGNGVDVFIYNANKGEGRDHITDFEDGVDLIRIKGAAFDDLSIRKAGGGADTKIILDSGTQIILDGVSKSLIDVDSFDFV